MRLLRGLRELVHDAIDGVTNLVEETHESAARKPVELLAQVAPLEGPVRKLDEVRRFTARTVFDGVRAVNRGVREIGDAVDSLVGAVVDELTPAGAAGSGPALPAAARAWVDAAQGGLNGVLGDFLRDQQNGLAIELGFRHEGAPLALTREALTRALGSPTPKLCVFVHGLGCTELVFRPGASDPTAGADTARVDYGARLTSELGFTALYVRYNSGLHVSENGRELARLLDELVASYPCELQELALIGHSMGGLVARSAAHYAQADQRAWIRHLRHVVCIGSPHLGAPLEKAGNAIASVLGVFDVAGTQVPAKLLNARSAGIKDLRFGYVLDEEWTDRDPDTFLRDERRDVPFAEGVSYAFIAATCHLDAKHPLGTWLGDMLVRVPSASGQAPDATRHIPFHLGSVLHGIHHQALLTHPKIYEQLALFLRDRVNA